MMDIQSQVKYYRVKIFAKSLTETANTQDARRTLRCPFQGYFVRLFEDPQHPSGAALTVGSMVKKGQPILVIEAMKMESTLVAPEDGKIEYLVENGDLSRLVRGKTSDGLILGKNLKEGEVLMMLAELDDQKASQQVSFQEPPIPLQIQQAAELTRAFFQQGNTLHKLAQEDPEYYFAQALDLLGGCLKGLIVDEEQLDSVQEFFSQIASVWQLLSPEKKEQFALDIHTHIEFVIFSRQLISPLVLEEAGNSFFEEMSDFFYYWDHSDYKPLRNFESVLLFLINAYGHNFDSVDYKDHDFRKIFYYVLRALNKQHVDSLKFFLELLTEVSSLANKTAKLFRRLLGSEILHDQQILTKVLNEQLRKLPVVSTVEVIATGNLALGREYLKEFRRFILYPLDVFENAPHSQQDFCREGGCCAKEELGQWGGFVFANGYARLGAGTNHGTSANLSKAVFHCLFANTHPQNHSHSNR